MAFLLGKHIWEELLDSAPVTEEIDVEYLPQLLRRDVENCPSITDTSIVDQDGGMPQIRACGVCGPAYVISRSNVALIVVYGLLLCYKAR